MSNIIVAPNHWKQKGSQPIQLSVYDATTPIGAEGAPYGVQDKYSEVIQETIGLWSACAAFKFTYYKIGNAESKGNGIYFRNSTSPSPTDCRIECDKNIISRATVEWSDSAFLQIPDSETQGYEYKQLQRIFRHEMGHALGLDHVYLNGNPDPNDCMGSGYEVTQADLDRLCKIYRC